MRRKLQDRANGGNRWFDGQDLIEQTLERVYRVREHFPSSVPLPTGSRGCGALCLHPCGNRSPVASAGRDISATRFAYLTEPPYRTLRVPLTYSIPSSIHVLPLDSSPLSTTLDSIYLQSCCELISWSRRKLDYIAERRMLLIDRV